MTVRLTHVQFDSDHPVKYNPILNLLIKEDSDSVEIQSAICDTLEFHYGRPVDYAIWEAL